MTKNPRKKRCVFCNALFSPMYSTLQKACSPKCAMSYAEKKKSEARMELETAFKEKKESDKLSRHLEATKRLVHKYVRLRDKGKPCVSCGEPYKQDHQAGHYHKAELYKRLRFDIRNINGQCVGCNIRKDGNLEMYAVKLPNRIGAEAFEELRVLADLEKKLPVKKWTRHELKEIQEEVKRLIRGLK